MLCAFHPGGVAVAQSAGAKVCANVCAKVAQHCARNRALASAAAPSSSRSVHTSSTSACPVGDHPLKRVVVRRSVLYVPGSNTRALAKAGSCGADALIVDLEDAVAPHSKPEARQNAKELPRLARGELAIRINPLSSKWGMADMEAALEANVDAVVVPKVESASMVRDVVNEMEKRNCGVRMQVWPMIETPLGVLRALDIATAHPRVGALVAGTSDLTKDLHAIHTPNRMPLLTSLSTIVLAARAAGVTPLDGVHLDIKDEHGFHAACVQGRELGFDGKTLIHPSTIEACNSVFAPTADAINEAREIIEAFAAARQEGKGVVVLRGKLVENLHVQEAKHTLAVADALGLGGE